MTPPAAAAPRSPARQTERVLVYAIVRAADAFANEEPGAAEALLATVRARRAWWKRRQTRARRVSAA